MADLNLRGAEGLHETNLRLRHALNRVRTKCGQRRAATPEDVAGLLSELLQAGARFRLNPLPVPGSDQEMDLEVLCYRQNVEELRDLLPSIHRQLLAERARIEGQRARLASAAEWAQTSRQTL